MKNNLEIYEDKNELRVWKINDDIPWSKDELWRRFRIVYDGIGVHPILVTKIMSKRYSICIGHEDDGKIWFDLNNHFDGYWLSDLIRTLEETKKKIRR